MKKKLARTVDSFEVCEFKALKTEASETIYPRQGDNKTCSLLLASNLAFPQWINTDCTVRLLSHVVCFNRTTRSQRIIHKQIINAVCPNMSIYNAKECFSFHAFKRQSIINMICHNEGMNHFSNFRPDKFEFLFNALGVGRFHLLSAAERLRFVKYQRFAGENIISKHPISTNLPSMFFVCAVKAKEVPVTFHNIFRCSSGGFVSLNHVCSKLTGCTATKHTISSLCLISHCSGVATLSCSPLYYTSITGEKKMFTFQSTSGTQISFHAKFNCSANLSIDYHLIDDLIPDCTFSEDESVLHLLLTSSKKFSCLSDELLPCLEGHTKCFNVSSVCHFRLDRFNNLHPCRTGSHMQECKNFECHQSYKCPDFYCVPWGYVCDEKWDCPFGEDEMSVVCGVDRKCAGMFKCWESQICVHLYDICNAVFDCPLKDDEHLCELRDVQCPFGCDCLLFAITCHKIHSDQFPSKGFPFVFLHLHSLSLTKVEIPLQNNFINNLNVSANRIVDICVNMELLHKLHTIDFSENIVLSLVSGCFANVPRINMIIAVDNKISNIEFRAFINATQINLIDLSHNDLLSISKLSLCNVLRIKVLNLNHNPMQKIHQNLLQGLEVQEVISDDFHVCCVVSPEVTCSGIKLWYTSCLNLLPNVALQTMFLSVSLLLLLVNIWSLCKNVWAMLQKCRGKTFSVLISSLNTEGVLFAAYFLIIWSTDVQFGDSFVVKDNTWRESMPCNLAFLIILTYSLAVPYLLCFSALVRVVVVAFPLKNKFKSPKFTRRVVLVGRFVITLTGAGVCCAFRTIGTDVHHLCTPFVDLSGSEVGIHFFTLTSFSFQMVSFAFITVVSAILLCVLVKHVHKKVGSGKINLKSILLQMLLGTVSNFFAWVCPGTIFLTTQQLENYPVDFLFWTIVLIVPLNSLTTPFILNVHSKSARTEKTRSSVRSTSSYFSRTSVLKGFASFSRSTPFNQSHVCV